MSVTLNVFQLMERSRNPGVIGALIGGVDLPDVVYTELCQADPAQSVFVLPSGGDNLRLRVCAASRQQLMEFALDVYRHVNMSSVQRQVSEVL